MINNRYRCTYTSRKSKIFKQRSVTYDDASEWKILNSFLSAFGLRLQDEDTSGRIRERIYIFLSNVRLLLIVLLNLIQLIVCTHNVIVSTEKRKPFIFSCCMVSVFAAQLTTYRKKVDLTEGLKRMSCLLAAMSEGHQMQCMTQWLKIRCFAILVHAVVSFIALSQYLSGERILLLFGLSFEDPHLPSAVITIVNYIVVIHVVILTTFIQTIALLCCFVYEKERHLIKLWKKIAVERIQYSDLPSRDNFYSELDLNQEMLLKIPSTAQIGNFPLRHQTLELSKHTKKNQSMKRGNCQMSKASPILIRDLTYNPTNEQGHGSCDNLPKIHLGLDLSRYPDHKSPQLDQNFQTMQRPIAELSSAIAPQEFDFHYLMFFLSKIAFNVKEINENLSQLNLFVMCVLLSVISTTINDLLLGARKYTAVVLGYSIFCGLSNTFLFVYLVLKASNVSEEYSRTKSEILHKLIGSQCVFRGSSKRMDASCFLTLVKSMSPHFIITCMGLFDVHKSIILTTFGCAVTYGVILMQMK